MTTRFEQVNSSSIEKEKYEHDYLNHIEIVMPANTTDIAKLSIDASASYQALTLTGSYTTKQGAGDDGICRTRISIEDSGFSRKITNGFIPVDLLLSPGRVKSVAGAGDASNTLFMPLRFKYYFKPKSDIIVHWKNLSDTENTLHLCWNGIRYESRK